MFSGLFPIFAFLATNARIFFIVFYLGSCLSISFRLPRPFLRCTQDDKEKQDLSSNFKKVSFLASLFYSLYSNIVLLIYFLPKSLFLPVPKSFQTSVYPGPSFVALRMTRRNKIYLHTSKRFLFYILFSFFTPQVPFSPRPQVFFHSFLVLSTKTLPYFQGHHRNNCKKNSDNPKPHYNLTFM